MDGINIAEYFNVGTKNVENLSKINFLYYKTTFTECLNIFKSNIIRPTSNAHINFISTSKLENCTYCEVLIKLDYKKLLKKNIIKEHNYSNGDHQYLDFQILTTNYGLKKASRYIVDIIVNFKHNCKDHTSYRETCTKCKYNEYRINHFEQEMNKLSELKIKFNYA